MPKFKIGDVVRGANCTNLFLGTNMTMGVVRSISLEDENSLSIELLKHKLVPDFLGEVFHNVKSSDLELILSVDDIPEVAYCLPKNDFVKFIEYYNDFKTMGDDDMQPKFAIGDYVVERDSVEFDGFLLGKVMEYGYGGYGGGGNKFVTVSILDHDDVDMVGHTMTYFEDDLELAEFYFNATSTKPKIVTKVENGVTFIVVEDRYTICVPTTENVVGISIKSVEDEYNEEIGKALAFYRTIKQNNEQVSQRKKLFGVSY